MSVQPLQYSGVIGTPTGGGGAGGGGVKEYYITAAALDRQGINPPPWKQFKNDGTVGTDKALQYVDGTAYTLIDTSGGYTALSDVINGTTAQYTIEFYIRPERVHYEYISTLGSNCGVRLDNVGGQPGYRLDFGSTAIIAEPALQISAWNHVIIKVDNLTRECEVWTNGQHKGFNSGTGSTTMYTDFLEFGDGSDGTAIPTYAISEYALYNTLFNEEQALAKYNNGVPTETLPTGITDANRVLHLKYDSTSGNAVLNEKGPDGVITGTEGVNFSWVSGALGTGGSFGAYAPAFEFGARQYSALSLPVPNDWSLDTDITPHVHFSVNTAMAAGETITFGFEYTIAREDEVFGNTQTALATYTATGTEPIGHHGELYWTPIAVPGTSAEAPHIVGTVFRDSGDTFAHDAFFVNFGVKYTSA